MRAMGTVLATFVGSAVLTALAIAPAYADDDEDEEEEEAKPKAKKAANAAEADEPELQKQNLSSRALGTTKQENIFERDRFFVDKTDSAKTEKGTLIQGSLTSTTFGYYETGGTLAPTPAAAALPPIDIHQVPSASPYQRLFTDLRLQTDFRHIAASRWEARVDLRARAVNDPAPTNATLYQPGENSRVQSGFLGENELEVKEAWVVRNGLRSDVFLGRQFVPDLGGVKFDGLRIDYASSVKFTLLGFGGLYPIRGSRSITSDYTTLQSNPNPDGTRAEAGKFTGIGGFGAAYRTDNMYGAFGGVALVPFAEESPRIYATSTGYMRVGPALDVYHFAIVDVVGNNPGITNLSAGLNWKPDQRLRATLSVNRVDTETLNVQAQAFLSNPDPGANFVQNDAYLIRIASNQARASLSAALGSMQRFEVTAAAAFRYRGETTLTAPPQTNMMLPRATTTLPAAQSVEVYGSIVDRRSFADLRLGVDGSRVFGVGSSTYQRSKFLSVRAFGSRVIADGKAEIELEVAYSTNQDDSAGVNCVDLSTCFGAAESTVISGGGNFMYRLNRDWFLLASLFVNRAAITHIDMAGRVKDPAATGLSGYFRLAYRF